MTNSTYTAPTVIRIGTFEEVTQGKSTGTRVDATYVTGQVATFLS